MTLFAIAWLVFWVSAWLLITSRVWRIVFRFKRVEAQIVALDLQDGSHLLTLKILGGEFQGRSSWLALPGDSTVGYPINGKLVVALNPKDPSVSELPISKIEAVASQVLFLIPLTIYFLL